MSDKSTIEEEKKPFPWKKVLEVVIAILTVIAGTLAVEHSETVAGFIHGVFQK